MRAPVVALAFLISLTSVVSVAFQAEESGPKRPSALISSAASEGEILPAASSSEFIMEPTDGEWLRFSPAAIRIHFLNASLGVAPEQLALWLDENPRTVSWSDATDTVEAVIDEGLADGVHSVEAHLVHEDASVTDLAWSFGLDTLVPDVEVDPLPPVTSDLSIELRGRATDAWLVSVTVLGREVPVVGGNFTTEIRLWPGLNDITVEARDLAGNLGRAFLVIALETAAFEGAVRHLVVESASFAIDIPEEWVAQEGIRLPSGNRADLIALAPFQPGLETSVIVASDRTSYGFSGGRALEWMDLVVASVEATGQLRQVISRPRLLQDSVDTVSVQSTFLRQTASSQVAFMEVVMIWSRLLRIQWVILASTDWRGAVEIWPALNQSTSSFQVLDQGLGESPTPESAFVTYTAVVVGATAVILAIAILALLPTYLGWRRAKRAGRWRPPRNWGL